MSTISKDIEKLVKSSKQLRNPKEALEAVFQMAFLSIGRRNLFQLRFPSGFLEVQERLCTPLRMPAMEMEALKLIVQKYMNLVTTSEPFSDILGGLYDQYLGEELGQFFTPPDIAQLLANLQVLDTTEIQEGRCRAYLDVCVGGGSLILACMNANYVLHGNRGVALMDIAFQDISEKMCKLTSMQILMSSLIHGIPFSSLSVRCGNALIASEDDPQIICIPRISDYLLRHRGEDSLVNVLMRRRQMIKEPSTC